MVVTLSAEQIWSAMIIDNALLLVLGNIGGHATSPPQDRRALPPSRELSELSLEIAAPEVNENRKGYVQLRI